MKKFFIKNRKGQKLVLIVNQSKNQAGLVFILHGLGGFKEQPQIQIFAKAFTDNNYTVVLFDVADTIGESEPGNCENTSVSNHYQDLEDVINWAKKQAWYQQPFCLAGHSLGGIAVALYAQRHPQQIKGLAPISTVVSGQLSAQLYEKEKLKSWQNKGYKLKPSHAKPGVIKKVNWSEFEDRLNYDLLPAAHKLSMPVLLIVGENDTSMSPQHQRILFDALPGGKKEFYIIQGAPHTFRDQKHLNEIYNIFNKWIKNYL